MRGLGQLAADRAYGPLDEYGYREAQVALLAERALAGHAGSSAHLAPPPEDAYEALERALEMTPGEFETLVGRLLCRVEVTKGELSSFRSSEGRRHSPLSQSPSV